MQSTEARRTLETSIPRRRRSPVSWAAVARRVARPMHHSAVHALRIACQQADAAALARRLEPDVAVVVDAGDPENPTIRVVRGVRDALPLLFHGMSAHGIEIAERSVNSQPGLMLHRGDEGVATISVDFSGRLISVIWVRLHPEVQRHWNHV